MTHNLVTLTGVAVTCGVTKSTAHRYTRRSDFPAPLGELPTGRVWRRGDVERWAKRTLPLQSGRPPSDPKKR